MGQLVDVAGARGKRVDAYLNGGKSGSAGSLNDGTLGAGTPTVPGQDALPDTPGTGCSRTTFQWGDASGTFLPNTPNLPCETDERANEVTELTYTTPALAAPVTVNGPINAHLVGSLVSGTDMPLTVRITDVAPNGTSTQVSAGWLRASLRATASSPVVETLNGKVLRTFHPFTQASVRPVPSTPTAYDVEIFPTFQTFQVGHRIRVDVGGGDVPHAVPSAPHQANDVGAVMAIGHDATNPSYVTLPQVSTS